MDRRWPLHPQPREWEGLETWVRRIAEAHGVGYDTFLHHAPGRTGRGARDLDHLDDRALERLSAGTGVPIEQLRAMQTGSAMARVTERIQGWLESDEGRAALDQLRVSLMHMMRRAEAEGHDRERRLAIEEQAGLRRIDGTAGYVTS